MLKLGFNSRWVNLIMQCVCTFKYSTLMNDKVVGPIIPERGLRQGFPLSPHLFILYAQGFTALIEKTVNSGDLHGFIIFKEAFRV